MALPTFHTQHAQGPYKFVVVWLQNWKESCLKPPLHEKE